MFVFYSDEKSAAITEDKAEEEDIEQTETRKTAKFISNKVNKSWKSGQKHARKFTSNNVQKSPKSGQWKKGKNKVGLS
jgi:hypothetical protein